MYIPKNGSTHEFLAEKLLNRNSEHRLDVYIQSLPTTCQLPMCEPLNAAHLTLKGQALWREHVRHFETWSHAKKVAWSVVQSRTWHRGMIPVVDLFNHDIVRGLPLQIEEDSFSVKTSTEWTLTDDELFDSYGFKTLWRGYLHYGFLDEELTPTCEDALLLRFDHMPRMRVACIANASSTLEDMVDELRSAVAHEDLCMIKGAAQWLDNNLVYGPSHDEE